LFCRSTGSRSAARCEAACHLPASQSVIERIESIRQSLNSNQFGLPISCINESIIAQVFRKVRVIRANQRVNQSMIIAASLSHILQVTNIAASSMEYGASSNHSSSFDQGF
jgi:hypothetical protein